MFLANNKGGSKMCKIKTGKNVNCDKDLQNIVTSIILRQNYFFNESSILKVIHTKLKNSALINQDTKIENIIHTTFNVLERNDVIFSKDGIYCLGSLLIS